MIVSTISKIDFITATMAATSVFLLIVVISWPYLVPDTLGARMRELAEEREGIRIRERRKLHQNQSLRTEPKKIFKNIVDRFNLAEQLNDSAMVQQLRMAGFRGQGPIVTFISVRILMPVLLFTVATLYLFVVIRAQYPFFPKLAIAIAVA